MLGKIILFLTGSSQPFAIGVCDVGTSSISDVKTILSGDKEVTRRRRSIQYSVWVSFVFVIFWVSNVWLSLHYQKTRLKVSLSNFFWNVWCFFVDLSVILPSYNMHYQLLFITCAYKTVDEMNVCLTIVHVDMLTSNKWRHLTLEWKGSKYRNLIVSGPV